MAGTGKNKKSASTTSNVPDCPVCMETMTVPIFQCQSGHSLCHSCTKNLCPPTCPICRQVITQMRNWALEEMVSKVKVVCPNKALGCTYMVTNEDVDEHVKECIFRDVQCPHGKVFGTCSWTGKIHNIVQHFKDSHPENINTKPNFEFDLKNVSVSTNIRHMFIIQFNKRFFILSFKIDTVQKLAYWTVQFMGLKKAAKDYIYEIHVTSKQNEKRMVTFTDNCFNDIMDANDIFLQAKCAVMPLNMLTHFISDKQLSFRCVLKTHLGKKADGPNKNNKGNADQKGGPKPKPQQENAKKQTPNPPQNAAKKTTSKN